MGVTGHWPTPILSAGMTCGRTIPARCQRQCSPATHFFGKCFIFLECCKTILGVVGLAEGPCLVLCAQASIPRQKVVRCSPMSKAEAQQKLATIIYYFICHLTFVNSGIPNVEQNCMVHHVQDKEETAQWVSAPGTIKAILEAALSRVSTMKQQGCIIHHYTCYDGNLEKAGVGKCLKCLKGFNKGL